VDGTRVEFNDSNLGQYVDLARVRKIYKLNAGSLSSQPKKSNGKGEGGHADSKHTNGIHEEVDELVEMEAVILGTMALKGS
jgi:EKC/KEOPS complex subunit CGI121/TPRKB